jgi:hypothetical protein
MPISQEKFQITVPEAEEGGDPWVDFAAFETQVRQVRITPSVIDGGVVELKGRHGSDNEDVVRLNIIPSTGISEPVIENQSMSLVLSGRSDVSRDTNQESKRKGFKHLGMKGTDDQYSGEHQDLFYGEATVPGVNHDGFVERNNYLDRE